MGDIRLIIRDVSIMITNFVKSLLPNITHIRVDVRGFAIHLNNADPAGVRFLSPGELGVYWSVDDFEHRAKERFTLWQGRGEHPEDATWNDIYDKTRFHYALQQMIDGHDAENGITWLTIDWFLEEYCLKL